MARKQTVIVQCDNPKCKTIAEVADLSNTPAHWYRVGQVGIDGKVHMSGAKDTFDICSLPCLSRWANARKEALVADGATNPSVNGPKPPARGSVQAGEINKEAILNIIANADHAMRSSEISELTGFSQGTVDRHLASLAMDKVVQVENIRDKSPTGFVRLYSAAS